MFKYIYVKHFFFFYTYSILLAEPVILDESHYPLVPKDGAY